MEAALMIYEITAPDFNAGFILWYGHVRAGTSDRIKFMRGWHLYQVRKYCQHRGWIIQQAKP